MNNDILVRVGADISDFTRKMGQVVRESKGLSNQINNLGQSMFDIGTSATKATAPLTALGAAVGALGLNRIMDGERVAIMFDTIYDSASDAEKAMDSVLDIVRGTRYGLNEIADPFAQLKSTGVEDATAQMAMLANMNLASMKGSPELIQQLTSLQQSALAMGRMDGTMINSFASAFVDVPVIVGNALGKTREETRDFLSNGAYDVEEIMNIISDGILNGSQGIAGETVAMGGMIDAEGQTLAGKWANMKAAMARAGETVWQDSGAFDGLKTTLDGITDAFDNTAEAFVPAAKAIAGAIKNVVDIVMGAVNWFVGLNDSTQQLLANIVVGAVAFGPILMIMGKLISAFSIFAPVIKLVSNGVMALGAVFGIATAKVWLIVGAITAIVAGLVYAYNNVEWFRDMVNVAWQAIVDAAQIAFGLLLEVIGIALDFVRELWEEHGETIINAAKAVWETILTVIDEVVGFISNIIQQVFGHIQEFWAKHGEAILESASTAWNSIKTAIDAVLEVVKAVIGGALGFIKGLFEVIWPIISGIVEVAWNLIKTIISTAIDVVAGIIDFVMSVIKGDWESAWDAIWGIVTDIWDNIVGFFEGVDLFQIGKDIIQGLINGIGEMASAVWETAKGIANNIIGAITGTLDTHSPSRLMKKIGKWTGEGLAMGMDDMVGSVGKSAAKLAQAAIVPVTSAELSPSLTSSSKLSSSLDVNHRDDTAVPYLSRIANAMEAGQDVYIDGKLVGAAVKDTVSRELQKDQRNVARGAGMRYG